MNLFTSRGGFKKGLLEKGASAKASICTTGETPMPGNSFAASWHFPAIIPCRSHDPRHPLNIHASPHDVVVVHCGYLVLL